MQRTVVGLGCPPERAREPESQPEGRRRTVCSSEFPLPPKQAIEEHSHWR